MKIGIGLPVTIPGTQAGLILEWAQKADEGPFSCLGILDRLVYSNFEPMITLTAAAAVTQRIRLMTSILVAPLRNAGILAKQAATLDAFSGGRFTLGVAVGRREEDYQTAPAPFHNRGKRFEEQLNMMRRIWSREPLMDGGGTVGPNPLQKGGPELLIGGRAPISIRRVGRWADGYISGPGAPHNIRQNYRIAQEAWEEAGRAGQPRLVGSSFYALGSSAEPRGIAFLSDYYQTEKERAQEMILSSPEAVDERIQAYIAIGMDELILWPTVADLDQVDRLAAIIA